MKTLAYALAFAGLSATAALANDIPSKVQMDLLGRNAIGMTANPTAQPADFSLSAKAMRDAPGVTGPGRTANPTAKPFSGSLADKVMRDQLGRSAL